MPKRPTTIQDGEQFAVLPFAGFDNPFWDESSLSNRLERKSFNLALADNDEEPLDEDVYRGLIDEFQNPGKALVYLSTVCSENYSGKIIEGKDVGLSRGRISRCYIGRAIKVAENGAVFAVEPPAASNNLKLRFVARFAVDAIPSAISAHSADEVAGRPSWPRSAAAARARSLLMTPCACEEHALCAADDDDFATVARPGRSVGRLWGCGRMRQADRVRREEAEEGLDEATSRSP